MKPEALANENNELRQRLSELEEELRQARQISQSFKRIIESMPYGVAVADLTGVISYINQSFVDILRIADKKQLIGKRIFDLQKSSLEPPLDDMLTKVLGAKGSWGGEMSISRCDGSPLLAEVLYFVLKNDDDQPEHLLALYRDITSQRQIEEETLQTQKMDAIGTLAGGVAHDMNNVLAAITNLAESIRLDGKFSKDHRQDIEDILNAAKKGSELSRNLLGFARKGKYCKERISLNELVEDVRDHLIHAVPRNVDIQLILDETLPEVEGDYAQISHAIMNICLNAVDAMEGVGVITCVTKRMTLDRKIPGVWSDLDSGEYAQVVVIDAGMGMSRETLEHVFEPFFTTKKEVNATGLGLSMAYGTLSNHGGAIDIESHLGAGTKVTLMLPVSKNANTRARDTAKLKVVNPKETPSLLVVDDEDLIRKSAQRLLTKLGYTVHLAANGLEAVECVEKQRDNISLIILDLIMPKMDGEKAFYKIKEIAPNIPVLISSGYAKDSKVDRLLNDGATGFLQKPFDTVSIEKEIMTATLNNPK